MRVIGSKWVLCQKLDADGNPKFKARLVAQGFAQVKNVDYFETYSPVVKGKTVRLLLALAKENDWVSHHVPGVQLKVTLARATFKSAPHSPPPPTSALRADWLAGDCRSAAEWTENGSQSKRACGVRRLQAAAGGAMRPKGGGGEDVAASK